MPTVLILGGGIIGLSVAWWLQRLGYDVTVYESAPDGTQAAGYVAAGMLAAQLEQEPSEEALAPLLYESQRLWPAFRDALHKESGLTLDYQDAGTMRVATDRDGLARLRHEQAYMQRWGRDAQWLTSQQARHKEPLLSPQTLGALFCPTDHHVDPRRVLAALQSVLGPRVQYQRAAADLCPTQQGVSVTDNTGNTTVYHRVIIASGAWAGQGRGLIPQMPRIDPVKGQALILKMAGPNLSHVVWGDDVYLVPRGDGLLYIGATVEHVGFDHRLTVQAVYHLLKEARLVLPAVLEASITETLIGYRPRPLNDIPIVQPSTIEGVLLALGHYRNGVLLAPWTCQMIAGQVTGDRLRVTGDR